jgi:hypothetical protein
VAFAVLGIGIAGGIGGLYTHRQNQEAAKKQQIAEMTREVDSLRERNAALDEDCRARLLAPTLQLAVKEQGLPLRRIQPHQVRPLAPKVAAARAKTTDESSGDL